MNDSTGPALPGPAQPAAPGPLPCSHKETHPWPANALPSRSISFPPVEDLPLFSGAPVVARERTCVAQPMAAQPAFFDLRPDPFATRSEEYPVTQPCPPAQTGAPG